MIKGYENRDRLIFLERLNKNIDVIIRFDNRECDKEFCVDFCVMWGFMFS